MPARAHYSPDIYTFVYFPPEGESVKGKKKKMLAISHRPNCLQLAASLTFVRPAISSYSIILVTVINAPIGIYYAVARIWLNNFIPQLSSHTHTHTHTYSCHLSNILTMYALVSGSLKIKPHLIFCRRLIMAQINNICRSWNLFKFKTCKYKLRNLLPAHSCIKCSIYIVYIIRLYKILFINAPANFIILKTTCQQS